MAEKNTHEITLSGYKAGCKETALQLGVRGSSGMERLHITPLGAWAGMTITATFHNGENQSEPRVVNPAGYVAVPAIATQQADKNSRIVFYGTDGTSSVYTADIRYRVEDRSDTDIESAAKDPGKNAFEQYIQQTENARDTALQAAQNARESARGAGTGAESAQSAASEAAQSAAAAQGYAGQAKQSAQTAQNKANAAQNSSENANDAMKKAQAAAASAQESADKIAAQPEVRIVEEMPEQPEDGVLYIVLESEA